MNAGYAYGDNGGAPHLRYFATLPTQEIGLALKSHVDRFYTYINSSGVFERLRRSYRCYFGFSSNRTGGPKSSAITRGGLRGELALVHVNQYRNFGINLLNLVTQSKPTWTASATNSDHKSEAQTLLANELLAYYYRAKHVETISRNATELALYLGEGYQLKEWDTSLGEAVMLGGDGGPPVKEGDIRFTALTPMDVIKDTNKEGHEQCDWLIVRTFANKFELAVKYPALERDLVTMDTKNTDLTRLRLSGAFQESDDIPVYQFFHRRTDAVPDGRQTMFCSDKVLLFDGPLAYREIPVYRIAAGEMAGTPFGYSPLYDLLGIQELLNALYTIVATNQTTFGVQVVTALKGHGISYKQLAQGLTLIEYAVKDGKPEPMNFTMTPKEVFTFIDKLERVMEVLSGVNAVVRGSADAFEKDASGSKLALIQAQAIQFVSGLAQSYNTHLEQLGMGVINDLRDFSTSKRVVKTVGQQNKPLLSEFTSDDLSDVDRVTIQTANPLLQTLGGVMQVADNLLQRGAITPERYVEMLRTNRLEEVTDEKEQELMRVKQENERLSQGVAVRALITDRHWLDIPRHRSVLDTPDSRDNPNAPNVQATLAHIQEHLQLWRSMDPGLLMLLGGPPPPPPPMMMGPPGGPPPAPSPGGPPRPPAPPMKKPAVAGKPPPALNASQPGQAAPPRLPMQPKSPQTAQRWNAVDGGGAVPQPQ